MSIFDDFSRFLEERLEEFLRSHPQLELQVLEEQLQEQEQETQRLRTELQAQEKRLQSEILATAQEIQRWHLRIQKAEAAGRRDLVQAAQEREASLLRQGNQRWGQMEALKAQIQQTQQLLGKIQARRREVQQRVAQAGATASPSGQASSQVWETASNRFQTRAYGEPDPLEEQFRRWEMDEELEQLKRKLGR